MHHPLNLHFCFLKHVVRYIKATISNALLIDLRNTNLEAYNDYDWADNSSDHKSTTGLCILLEHVPIS